MISPQQAAAALAHADCLYSAQDVESALDRMADALTRDLHDQNPLVLCVMNGGLVVTGRLLPRLAFPLQVDYLHATRYRGALLGRELEWLHKPLIPLQGRAVLLVDDILDEGITLAAIQAWCQAQGALRVWSAVLVQKHHDRPKASVKVDFVGLATGDRYVFGYGMDYHEYLRNAAGIYALAGGPALSGDRALAEPSDEKLSNKG